MVRKSILRVGVMVAVGAAVSLCLSGVAQASPASDRWIDAHSGAWDPKDYPDCAEALGKFYVSGAAGTLGGPLGTVGGVASALPDIYLDCPGLEPWQQNGT